jgi:hypothetical protein
MRWPGRWTGRVSSWLTVLNQCVQIRFKAGSILRRMLKKQLDQAAFPCAEMARHPSLRQTMQHGHGLLCEQLFKLFCCHASRDLVLG